MFLTYYHRSINRGIADSCIVGKIVKISQRPHREGKKVKASLATLAMPGGHNCCVVGCTNYNAKTKNVSYLSFPRKGINAETDQWRSRLISCISRADDTFNPNTHRICSTHFDPKCLLFHGKLLSHFLLINCLLDTSSGNATYYHIEPLSCEICSLFPAVDNRNWLNTTYMPRPLHNSSIYIFTRSFLFS